MLNYLNVLQLHRHLKNPDRNLAGAGFAEFLKNGQIPDLPEPEPKSSTPMNFLLVLYDNYNTEYSNVCLIYLCRLGCQKGAE